LKEFWKKSVETYDTSKNEVYMIQEYLVLIINYFPGIFGCFHDI